MDFKIKTLSFNKNIYKFQQVPKYGLFICYSSDNKSKIKIIGDDYY